MCYHQQQPGHHCHHHHHHHHHSVVVIVVVLPSIRSIWFVMAIGKTETEHIFTGIPKSFVHLGQCYIIF
jgi:hypothetical protein